MILDDQVRFKTGLIDGSDFYVCEFYVNFRKQFSLSLSSQTIHTLIIILQSTRK